MRIIILPLILLLVILSSCEPKKVSYEDANKWYSDCFPHPPYHPGDGHALESVVYGHEGIDQSLCFENCKPTNCMSDVEPSRQKYFKNMKSCNEVVMDCRFKCMEDDHPIGEIAEHVEGGYYSDGSYYAMCKNPFENIHPTKDSYEKTKWQKDRDECLLLTSENNRTSTWDLSDYGMKRFMDKSSKYYRKCLNEKGYNITLY